MQNRRKYLLLSVNLRLKSNSRRNCAIINITRRWKELTDEAFKLFSLEKPVDIKLEFLEQILSPIAKKLNPLFYAQLASDALNYVTDDEDALKRIDELLKQLEAPEKINQNAMIFMLTNRIRRLLRLSRMSDAQEALSECTSSIEQLEPVEKDVYAAYYSVKADYHKVSTRICKLSVKTNQ